MLHCEVAIVGGGIGGLYTAESLLRHEKETNVCVFERNARLGGRFYDYVFPQVPDETVGRCIWFVFGPLLRKAMTVMSNTGCFVGFWLESLREVMGRAKTLILPKCPPFSSSAWSFSLHTIPCRQISC